MTGDPARYTRVPMAMRQIAEIFGRDLEHVEVGLRGGNVAFQLRHGEARVDVSALNVDVGDDPGAAVLAALPSLLGPFGLRVLTADLHLAQVPRGLDGGHFVYWPWRIADAFGYSKVSRGIGHPPGHDKKVLHRIHRTQEVLRNVEFFIDLTRRRKTLRIKGPLVFDTGTTLSMSERPTLGRGRVLGLHPILWNDITQGCSFALVDDRALALRDDCAFAIYVALQIRFRNRDAINVELRTFLREAGAWHESRARRTPGRYLDEIEGRFRALRDERLVDDFTLDRRAWRVEATRSATLPVSRRVGGRRADSRGAPRRKKGGAAQTVSSKPSVIARESGGSFSSYHEIAGCTTASARERREG